MSFLRVFLLLSCSLPCTLCDGSEYSLIKQSDQEKNSITLVCRDGTGIPIKPLVTWYFNGSLHSAHPCTVNASLPTNSSISMIFTPECQGYMQCRDPTKNSVSLPLLVEVEPVLVPGVKTAQINVVAGDTVVIPCGIQISSIGNFVIRWFMLRYGLTEIEDPKIGPDYSLTLSGEILEANYFCTAHTRFKISQQATGLDTTVKVLEYEPPKISDIEMSIADDCTVTFTVTAQGTNISYTWLINGQTMDNHGSEINPTPSMLKLSSVNNKDSLLVRVTNTDVRDGTPISDSVRAFIFATATTATDTCFTNVKPSTSDVQQSSEMFEIITYILIGVTALLFVIFAVQLIVCCYRRNQLCGDDQDKGFVMVKVDDQKIKFDVPKMNKNIGIFFWNIDQIISAVIAQVDQTGNEELSQELRNKAVDLKKIILDWSKENPCPPINEIRTDGSPPPYSEDSMSGVELDNHIPLESAVGQPLELDQLSAEPAPNTPGGVRQTMGTVMAGETKNSFQLLLPSLESCITC